VSDSLSRCRYELASGPASAGLLCNDSSMRLPGRPGNRRATDNELDVSRLSQAQTEEQFDERVIKCSTREEAEAEAARQQASDNDEATWIYLHVDGEWAAKRTPTNLPVEKAKHPLVEGVVGEVVGSLLDPGQWLSP